MKGVSAGGSHKLAAEIWSRHPTEATLVHWKECFKTGTRGLRCFRDLSPVPGARHWNDLNASALSLFLWLGHWPQRRRFAQRSFDYDARVFRENNLLSVRDPAGIERTCRTPITNSCGDIRRSTCNGHNRAHEAQAGRAPDSILARSCVWAMGLAFMNVVRAAGHPGQDQRNGDFVPWFGRDLPFGVARELPRTLSRTQPRFDALSLRARQ